MNPERTITLTRKSENGETEKVEVKMLYCAASETGYQSLSGKTMDVFFPTIEIGEDGKPFVKEMPKATDMDYIRLATACIVAAYERDKQDAPITSKDILYHCSREEIVNMACVVTEMHQEWLTIPKTIENEIKEDAKKVKNAETPTKRSRRS